MKTARRTLLLAGIASFLAGLAIPQCLVIPVHGATRADWKPTTFRHSPWGVSGVHKGIDVFAKEGTPVVSAGPGLDVCAGPPAPGGNVVIVPGNPPHRHYTIATPIPHVLRADRDVQGRRKMFCLDPPEIPGARASGRRASVAGR